MSEKPSLSLINQVIKDGFEIVAGVDEAGRGPWAGPVVAAAVIIDQNNVPAGINDSKKLSEDKREQLFMEIIAKAKIGISVANVERIDRDNILQATLWAMKEAIKELPDMPDIALIDGNKSPILPCNSRTVVKGDTKCLAIASASIVAKVTRDRIMQDLSLKYPEYGWNNNKGYGTKQHNEALQLYGITDHHRRSFKPIQKLAISVG